MGAEDIARACAAIEDELKLELPAAIAAEPAEREEKHG